ncbi:OLC1v1004395C1 [Oldenlandia corymbosa var. corymbosa]|uniref:OLC1v1004395C1 n=1 Tax=Oldenlandia corymbosa var. corymbosa TaxID=529605 RepID=A0AAV1DF67_OLDCO|nr:OLC1v1004395C1 [Oldenlandia corymbosa var. corymbosa]
MEDLGGSQLDGRGNTMKKRRSQGARRPRPNPLVFNENHDLSPLSSIPVSDDAGKVSSDDNSGDGNFRGKTVDVNQYMSRVGPSTPLDEDAYSYKRITKEGGVTGLGQSNGNGGNVTHYGLAGHQGMSVDSQGNENKLKKVKLKVGGVTRMIQAKSSVTTVSNAKTPKLSDGPHVKQKVTQDIAENDPLPDKRRGTQGALLKDFSKGKLHSSKEESRKMSLRNGFDKPDERSDSVRKSKRLPKKRILDDAFDEDEDDDEIRYLEKLRNPKMGNSRDVDNESSAKRPRNLSRNSRGGNYETPGESVRSNSKDEKRSRSDRGSDDTDYEAEEEQEMVSDSETGGGTKKRKQLRDPSDSPTENKREITLTTRQRALLSSKDASGASPIEFPNGLPPPPSRKQKEQLTEVEQQLKKAEAAQRRRLQNEKAAREAQEEAVKRILGQDSSRKKREDKLKKRQEELAQEKASNAQLNAANTIRWVMSPTGTFITFPEEMGLPKLFDPKPSSYPPPREKCAGPSCDNPYKYRDSKTKLPLCSLQCYKAIHREEMPTNAAY